MNPRDHMANERTFLAWVRTSIGIMALGFVVEKFTLFIKQLSALLGRSPESMPPSLSYSLQGFSSIFGLLLVAFGGLICLLAFIKYKKVENQLNNNNYKPSVRLNVIIMLAVLLIGVILVLYLKNNV